MKHKPNVFMAAACALLMAGCATQKIAYKLDDVPARKSPVTGKTLAIRELRDEREPLKDATPLSEQRLVKMDGEKWYINLDHNYKGKKPAPHITEMIASHMNHANLFKSVAIFSPEAKPDLILDGAIKRFEGFKQFSSGANAGTQFGLLGALVTSGIDSKFMGTTVLDLQLKQADGDEIIWEGEVLGKVKGEDYADGYGWSAYQKANDSLKIAISNLLEELRVELKKK